MRPKVETNRKFKARGVSLSQEMVEAATKRASAADLSFSKYIQRLIALDMAQNLVKPVVLGRHESKTSA